MSDHPDPGLEQHRWRQRLVLVFTDEPDAAWRRQLDILDRHRGGLDDRDLVCYRLVGETGEGPAGPLETDAARALRRRFEPEGFTVVLVGKDGGEKERWHAPVAAETLFGVIDAMPMRRREMEAD